MKTPEERVTLVRREEVGGKVWLFVKVDGWVSESFYEHEIEKAKLHKEYCIKRIYAGFPKEEIVN